MKCTKENKLENATLQTTRELSRLCEEMSHKQLASAVSLLEKSWLTQLVADVLATSLRIAAVASQMRVDVEWGREDAMLKVDSSKEYFRCTQEAF